MTSSDDLRSRLREAQAVLGTGRAAEAEAMFAAAVAEHPDSLPAALGLAEACAASGDSDRARTVLRALLDRSNQLSSVPAIARMLRQWKGDAALRVAITGHGTLDSLGDHLRVSALRAELAVDVHVSGFDQWAQDLLAPGSVLYSFEPQVIVLRLDADTLFPSTSGDPFAPPDVVESERLDGIGHIQMVLDAIGTHAPGATTVVHTFAIPEHPPLGLMDPLEPDGLRARFERLNTALLDVLTVRFPRALALDQDRIESGFGKAHVRDDRRWYLGSLPFADSFLPIVADEYVRVLRALTGRSKKCIVVDLDNTLWGGIVGEDGVEALRVGGTAAPGNAFADFQRALDDLRRRGIILAICSKNNPEDALSALNGHPGMVLRSEHFTAVRINWQDKATNLVEIARELNIGRDSMVFLDDNPVEREFVRQQLPEVLTPELPRDPAHYARFLRSLPVFDTFAVTAEDRERGRLYAEQEQRHVFAEQAAGDLTSYLHGLDITVRLEHANANTLPRIAQLINKTNQFNLTTRRYTEAQVAEFGASKDWLVCAATVADRFGDSGLTGVAVACKGPETWELDTFLLSCRVLGRGVEDALLEYVVEQARRTGAQQLRGRFVPTPKNAPAATFYESRGFELRGEDDDGATLWERSLTDVETVDYPAWLSVEKMEGTEC